MHDRNGKKLEVGDTVTILATVTHLGEMDEYCNVDLETVHGRRPDDAKEHIGGINTAVLEKVEAQ